MNVSALPGKAPLGGYLYAIAYSTGVIKVGRCDHPRQRFSQHRQLGDAFGATFTDTWLSPLHHNYTRNELALLDHADERCTRRMASEYFHGVDFAELVAYAQTLHFDVIDLAAHTTPTGRPLPPPLLDDYLLAELLGIDPAVVQQLVRVRAIPFRKVGRYIRFQPDQVDEIRERIAALAAA